jgi:hypothetical protein
MAQKKPEDAGAPEVFVSNAEASQAVRRAYKSGALRKIAPRIYTRNVNDTPEQIIKRNLWPLVGDLFPGAIVSHRTAIEGKPFNDTVFLTDRKAGRLKLPGLTIVRTKGAGPIDGDTGFINGLHLSSRARALLENLQASWGKTPKTLPTADIEAYLTKTATEDPEFGLNRIRDAARGIAPQLSAQREFERLDRTIGALQRTRKTKLGAPAAVALREGRAFDSRRIATFSALHVALRTATRVNRPNPLANDRAFQNVAFFDAYFSNYIEGTQFEVGEAIAIVFDHKIPEQRPADAHDVDGTFKVVGSFDNMLQIPKTFDDFLRLLRDRHRTILAGRPEMKPGEFKQMANQVGTTIFVAPPLVVGTLKQGWELLGSLEHPFARALFAMFVTAEVHPFNDGNGRIARAMMNSEVVAGGQCRIIIPSVYRSEYIGALRRLTNHADPDAFLRVMNIAQEFVSRIDFSDLARSRKVLTDCHAFNDPSEDQKLVLPAQMAI